MAEGDEVAEGAQRLKVNARWRAERSIRQGRKLLRNGKEGEKAAANPIHSTCRCSTRRLGSDSPDCGITWRSSQRQPAVIIALLLLLLLLFLLPGHRAVSRRSRFSAGWRGCAEWRVERRLGEAAEAKLAILVAVAVTVAGQVRRLRQRSQPR
jgi:hypothetical protein